MPLVALCSEEYATTNQEIATMSDFETNPLELEKHDPSSLDSLEQAIDSMLESNGCCVDPKHYHSFRAVTFLFPLRTCVVCSQRLQSVVALSSNKVVQCLACNVLAHRTCALSKTTVWAEPCPVNFKNLQSVGEKSLSLDVVSDQGDSAGGENNVPSNIAPNQDEDIYFGEKSVPSEIPPTVVADSTLQTEMDPLSCKNKVLPSPLKVHPGSQKNSLDDNELSTSTSLNDYSEEQTITPGELESAMPCDLCESPSVATKDASVLSKKGNERSYSKSNFHFLSASKLFPSKSSPILAQDCGSPAGSSEDTSIQRNHTWNGSTLITESTEEQESTLVSSSHHDHGQIGLDGFVDTMNKQQDEEENDIPDPALIATLKWTADGPPTHWATGKSLQTVFPTKSSSHILAVTGDKSSEDESALHFAIHSFASVSRALHENILGHFQPAVECLLATNESPSNERQEPSQNTAEASDIAPVPKPKPIVDDNDPVETNGEGLAEEIKAPSTDHKRLGLVTVAGGIAGGVAGLVVAGPMGGVIGVRLGQTAGILGVVLEGSFTIGVISSGIAAGSHAGQQLQEKINEKYEKRVLTLNGIGTNQGILLVRPSVQTDPEWAEICDEAKKSHQRGLPFSFLPSDFKAATRNRYERDIDIVTTDEVEIPTADKVLLLVSRILNNKSSMPGHVYRQLIEKMKERADTRGSLEEIKEMAHVRNQNTEESPEEASIELIRARRQDAHAVIKYVSAALLELRPGFAASPSITEYTASAVEGLVFGEIYDLVMEEIEAEFEGKDNALLEKVAAFERRHKSGEFGYSKYKHRTSEEALNALHCLPEAHSAVDKLGYCVKFLEKISEFFSGDGSDGSTPMGADSLLKLVCQHILVAKVFGIYAQIAFIDEFARDEQLLRGREGYALVTLQASLHFLHASTDINVDIFEQDAD